MMPPAAPNERLEMQGSANLSFACGGGTTTFFMIESASSTAIVVQPVTNAVMAIIPVTLNAPGSIYGCAKPTQGVVQPSGCNTVSWSDNMSKSGYSGKFNTGATSAATASLLATNSVTGRTCDQVCGALMNVCGDNREFYRLTLGPMQSADVEGVVQAQVDGGTFNLQAQDMGGGVLCNLLSKAAVNTTPMTYRARLVNNTALTKVVHLVPNAVTGDLQWNLAVAVESLDGGP
jgi:hypothetical protein